MDDLMEKTWKLYADALKLLNQGDYIDAAEKAWGAVEMIRKAFLISLGVPREKAGDISFGLPLFIKILKVLGRRDLINKYYMFDSSLHIKGFYEMLTPKDEIEIVIGEVKKWLDEIQEIMRSLKGMKLKEAIRLMDDALKVKRKILQESIKYESILKLIEEKIKAELEIK